MTSLKHGIIAVGLALGLAGAGQVAKAQDPQWTAQINPPMFALSARHQFLVELNGHEFALDRFEVAWEKAAAAFDKATGAKIETILDGSRLVIEVAQTVTYNTDSLTDRCLHEVRWAVPPLILTTDPKDLSTTVSGFAIIVHPQELVKDSADDLLYTAFSRLIAQLFTPRLGYGVSMYESCSQVPSKK